MFNSVQISKGIIQPKLTVNQPGDRYEKEADEMAERVMRMPADKTQAKPVTGLIGSSVQRKCANCEDERKKKIMRKTEGSGHGVQASPSLVSSINASKSGGEAIQDGTRRFMENAFSEDFSRIRVHTDSKASEMSNGINAKAFTTGRDIYFKNGEYQPNTNEGRHLLAHELVHVMQQDEIPDANIQMQSASDSFFFHTPASQTAPTTGIPTASQQMQQVFVEPNLSTVGAAPTKSSPGSGPISASGRPVPISVRFAYPAAEISTGSPSARINNAKKSILDAISQIISDTGTYSFSNPKQKIQIEQQRAKVNEVLLNYTPSNPLNIYIDTASIITSLKSNTVSAFTDNVYINLADVGDTSKLKAAILIPDLLLTGGVVGGGQQVPAATPLELQATLLHEGFHALLIRNNIDANKIWFSIVQPEIQLTGPPAGDALFIELVRKYLIAQEEVFAYAQEALLYPPVSGNSSSYSSFITVAESFFKKRSLSLVQVNKNIKVIQKVGGKSVPWSVSYSYPKGSLATFNKDQMTSMQLILSTYP